MNIAILSDIHGNAYALWEVLEVAKLENVKKVLVLGDIVGYYYDPDIVLEMLAQWDTIFIRGNHEEILEKIVQGTITLADAKKKYGSGHESALKQLPNKSLSWLISLPDSKNIEIDSVTLSMNHGSPIDQHMYLYPDTDHELLRRCDLDTDFVLVGHSHYEFIYRNQNSLLINVGSIGQLKSKGGIASWCIINTSSGTVKMMQTPYPVKKLIKDVEKNDPEIEYLKTVLTR